MTHPVTEQPFDPYQAFPNFYQNPAIASLMSDPRWTATMEQQVTQPDGSVKVRKKPLDMRALIENGTAYGAKHTDERSLVDLHTMLQHAPNLKNHTFYFNQALDQMIMLDIEPTCPPDIAAALLALPHLYSEVSMSGRGYHLLLQLPPNVHDFPDALEHKVLRHPQGWYEILVEHYITFTRIPITDQAPALRYTPNPDPAYASMQNLWDHLASQAPPPRRVDTSELVDPETLAPQIPERDYLCRFMDQFVFTTPLEKYDGDHSRWEYRLASDLYRHLEVALTVDPILSARRSGVIHHFETEHLAWLIYRSMVAILPARPKHEEMRNGVPLLMNTALNYVLHRREELADAVSPIGQWWLPLN